MEKWHSNNFITYVPLSDIEEFEIEDLDYFKMEQVVHELMGMTPRGEMVMMLNGFMVMSYDNQKKVKPEFNKEAILAAKLYEKELVLPETKEGKVLPIVILFNN